MKTLSTIVFAAILSLLIAKESKAQMGFGGPVVKITSLDGSQGLLMGGMGASGSENFYFGGGGFGLTNGDAINSNIESFGYGGLVFGYRKYPLESIGFYGQSFLAWGGGSFKDDTDFSMFILEPEVGISISPNNWLAIRAGLARRVAIPTSGIMNGGGFSGNSFALSFLFGTY